MGNLLDTPKNSRPTKYALQRLWTEEELMEGIIKETVLEGETVEKLKSILLN